MTGSLRTLLSPNAHTTSRRFFLYSAAASAILPFGERALAWSPVVKPATSPLKIEEVEVFELTGRYTEVSGVNQQHQVNPLDIYEALRYQSPIDKPGPVKEVKTSAVYLRIGCAGGLDGLYGPIERSAAVIVLQDLRHFLIGKD